MHYSALALSLAVAVTASYAPDVLARRAGASDEGVHLSTEALAEQAASSESAIATAGVPVFCSTRTLRGTYQYREEGTWQGEPYRSSGLETYDGRGNIVGRATDSDTGESYRFTGTYEVGGDCHGRIRYGGGFFYDLYAAPDGSTIELISTDLGAVLSGPSRRVSNESIIQ